MEWKEIKREYTTWNDKKNSGMIWKAKYSIVTDKKWNTNVWFTFYFILFDYLNLYNLI